MGQFQSIEIMAGMIPFSYPCKKLTLKCTSKNMNFLPRLCFHTGRVVGVVRTLGLCIDSLRNVCWGRCVTSVTVLKTH